MLRVLFRKLWAALLGLPQPSRSPFVRRPGKKPLEGVGILRYPQTTYLLGPDGPDVPARDIAERMGEAIGSGTVLVLPNTRDDHGGYVWDFRIEGGDPGQVLLKRME